MSVPTGYRHDQRRRGRVAVRRSLVDHPTPTLQPAPCRLWQGSLNGTGYGRIWDRAEQRLVLTHRYFWEQAYGTIPNGMVVRHKCDQPLCFRIDHLELGTVADNSADMMQRGRGAGQFAAGQDVTLTADDVRSIRAVWTGRYGQASELGREYGVHRSTILRIAKGQARQELV